MHTAKAHRRPWLLCNTVLLCVVVAWFAAPGSAQSDTPIPRERPLFEFHSGFWVNLHHFLYLAALSANAQKGPHPASLTPEDEAALRTLSAADRASWDGAVSYYARSVIQRDLLFDRDLAAVKDALEDAETSPDLASARIPAQLKAVLLTTAPVYRRHWWTAHDAENRAWIAQLQPLVAAYGGSLRNSLVTIYEVPWPGDPVRVDAVVYANWAGAYTTLYPTRPTISTREAANQGPAALEIVFHETSHGMMDKLMAAIHTAEDAVNLRQPVAAVRAGTIWHAVLFYTAGELVAERIPGYVPYADKNGLWKRAWPDPDRALVAQDWEPRIAGKAGLRESVTRLVEDLAVTGRPSLPAK